MNPSHVSKEQVIEKDVAALGSPCMKQLDRKEMIALGEYLSFLPLLASGILSFKRVQKNGSVYHSLSYKQVTARNSYTILFEDNDRDFSNMLVRQVHFYFQYKHPCSNSLSCAETCVCPVENLALIQVLPNVAGFTITEDKITHVSGLQFTATIPQAGDHTSTIKVIQVIPISAIKEKLVYMQCDEEVAFVSNFPNRVESD